MSEVKGGSGSRGNPLPPFGLDRYGLAFGSGLYVAQIAPRSFISTRMLPAWHSPFSLCMQSRALHEETVEACGTLCSAARAMLSPVLEFVSGCDSTCLHEGVAGIVPREEAVKSLHARELISVLNYRCRTERAWILRVGPAGGCGRRCPRRVARGVAAPKVSGFLALSRPTPIALVSLGLTGAVLLIAAGFMGPMPTPEQEGLRR